MSMGKYLKKELKRLQNKIYKALNIFEEENGINPKDRKEKNESTPITNDKSATVCTREVKNPLSFCDYIDRVVKNIEGIVFGIAKDKDTISMQSDKNERAIQDLSDIKYSLLSMRFIGDVDYYPVLRQKMFKNLDIVEEIINYVGNN